ncbi:5'-nucleotidase [Minicystis rosea]|nr:5'-nucleotidase [Minicystis rosea]
MRLLPGSRVGLVIGLALFAAGACSKTPHFVSDQSGGAGGSTSTGTMTGAGGAAPTPCVRTADCNMLDAPCAHPLCDEGVCKVQYAPLGDPTPLQIPGDCTENVCDGAGNVIISTDITDVPDDGNPCTNDSCDGMKPVHVSVPAGQACGAATDMKCDAGGRCTGCTKAADCGATGACFTWTCDADHVCQQAFVPAGMGEPGGDAPGDCKRNACDGNGGVVIVPAPIDLPANPSTCTLAACLGQNPTTAPAEAGVMCSGGTCDGMGHCGSCAKDADCGAPSACATPTCVGGHCSEVFAPLGTPAPPQTTGDCHDKVCDGNGAITDAPNDADVPPSTNACITMSCKDGAIVMTAVPVPSSNDPCIEDGCDPATGVFHEPRPNGTDCGGCSICDSGACVDPCPNIGCFCAGLACDCSTR